MGVHDDQHFKSTPIIQICSMSTLVLAYGVSNSITYPTEGSDGMNEQLATRYGISVPLCYSVHIFLDYLVSPVANIVEIKG